MYKTIKKILTKYILVIFELSEGRVASMHTHRFQKILIFFLNFT